MTAHFLVEELLRNARGPEWLPTQRPCQAVIVNIVPTSSGGDPRDGHHLGRPEAYVEALRGVLSRLDTNVVDSITDVLSRAWEQGRTVYIVGNGGSAATAAHLATDLSKGTATDGQPGLRAVSLADNVALLTAWANDTSYDHSFSGPLRAFLAPGDVLIAISASGRSPNVLEAVRAADSMGAVTIGLTGFGGGVLAQTAQIAMVVDAFDYGLVEDVHLSIGHALTAALKVRLRQQVPAQGVGRL